MTDEVRVSCHGSLNIDENRLIMLGWSEIKEGMK